MKSGLKLMAGVVGLGVALGMYSALGEDAAPAAAPAPAPKSDVKRPPLTDMTVTGKISKEEVTGRDGQKRAMYTLTDAAGAKVMLSTGGRGKPAADAPAPEAGAVKLEDYVGKDVTVTGKGFTMERNGAKMTHIVQITKIEAVAAPEAK